MSKLSVALDKIDWQEVWALIQTLIGLKASHDPDNGVDFSQAIANTQAAIEAHDVNKTPAALSKDTAAVD